MTGAAEGCGVMHAAAATSPDPGKRRMSAGDFAFALQPTLAGPLAIE
jgi:hypothetical protein